MKTPKIWIFILIAGLSSIFGQSQCSETGNAISLKGHRSGVYFVHKGGPKDTCANGIVPMFQTIAKNAAIYALFHYEHNIFAANTAKNMLQTAIETKQSENDEIGTTLDWKSFLEKQLALIELKLMQKDLSETEAKSEARAIVVIVDGDTVTQARIGNGRIASYVNDASLQFRNRLRLKEKNSSNDSNKLGGQHDRATFSNRYGGAEVDKINDDVKYIVLGTNYFWFANSHEIMESILENENHLNDAAREITESFRMPVSEKENGIIVIAMGQPKMRGKRSGINSLACCGKF